MVNIIYEDLPPKIKGLSKKNGDGSYTVMLNSLHTIENQRNALVHEMEHIGSGHFEEEGVEVNTIEKELRRTK